MRLRLAGQYGLSDYDAGVLIGQGRATIAYFEEAARVSGDAKAACNWVTNQVTATLKETGEAIAAFRLTAATLGDLIVRQKEMGLNKQKAGEVYAHLLSAGGSVAEAIQALGIVVETDAGAVVEIVRRAIAANPKAVADFKKGKTAAANSIKGAVMRETKGSVRRRPGGAGAAAGAGEAAGVTRFRLAAFRRNARRPRQRPPSAFLRNAAKRRRARVMRARRERRSARDRTTRSIRHCAPSRGKRR